MQRQSDLSLATGVFFAAGLLLSVLLHTVFANTDLPRNSMTSVAGVAAGILAIFVLVRGSRLRRITAATLMTITAVALLVFAAQALTGYRIMNFGLLFITVFVYFIWFMPRWYARIVGYAWLGTYTLLVITRFGGEIYLPLFTLLLTTLAAGELIGRFKDGLEAESLTDPLCEVWNRRGFRILLKRAVASAMRSGESLSVLYLDLDDFKRVNDTKGHAEGDRVLAKLAQDIEANTRPRDALGRIGGDEFALLLPATSAAEAAVIGERLRELVSHTRWSFGVAELRRGESVDAFLTRADDLMFERKRGVKRETSER